jgi:hypothetical protein
MTSYGFDPLLCNSQCEDFNQVSEDEYNEVMQMMAEENEALADMPTDEQVLWEREQDKAKNWLKGYSPIPEGETYEGIAI